MKLHLNLTLRRALLAAMAAVCTISSAWAGTMHPDATVQTYADFGQNRGRYVVGNKVNALLSQIRENDGGIAIPYTDTETPYVISNTQGMINFSGTADYGYAAMIGPTYLATVLHNGSLDGSFSERTLGSGHAINYEAIDIRGSATFRLAPENWGGGQYDYMLQRQSKVVTDVTWNPLTTMSTEEIGNLGGSLLYHSGSGTKYVWNDSRKDADYMAGAYSYIIGSINTISSGQIHSGSTEEDGTNFSLHINPDLYSGGGANDQYPLPLGAKPGDSGSPTFVYNTSTGQYEYIAAIQSAGLATNNTYGQARGNVEWTAKAMERFNERVDMSGTSTVHLGAITTEGDTISDTVGGTEYKTTLYTGNATDADGKVLASYIGVQSGTNTWKDLSDRKDYTNWYAHQNRTTPDILGRTQVISDLNVSDADLFFTENLVFTPSQATNNIILDATVDLGIGYAEFNKGTGMEKAVFNISAAEGSGAVFNHAGYVINDGAEVHVKLTNPDTYMTEWRKVGAGSLYIDGTGNTNALLNVGGSGKTYLQQSGGHAAYNVLASSGATVVISNTSQIERDFTFGAGGGTLDMNGNDMDWYTTGGETRAGFTINALTEEAIITNTSSTNSLSQSTLTYKQSGNTTFAGSFQDSATGTLSIVYDGGADSTWTLNSIHTNLTNWGNSGITVNSGKVILSGTNTIHGLGSANGNNTARFTDADDWHYADAAMNVEIKSGATFELGSHARLKGEVYINDGGTFILRESVKHQYEYVEGGASKENTYLYADYYGFKGNNTSYDIYLGAANSTLKIQYSDGTTANTTLAATIYGKGSVSVDAGLSGGTLTLSGNNSSMTGTKTLISGGLIATTANSLGNTSSNKWLVQEKGWIASTAETGASLLGKLDANSSGVLALSANTEDAISVAGHKGLYIGAMAGTEIDYGTIGTSTALAANSDGNWLLGGGGGTLNVHFLLTGDNNLIIGNEYSSGTVHLTNTANNFTGTISILGTGNILTYDNGALGDARIALTYGNTLALHNAEELAMLTTDAQGALAITKSMDLDLTDRQLSLGAAGNQTYTSKLTVGDKYRFGGIGNLTLDTELNSSDSMEIDGQGNSGSSVTFARENAYSGNITAGGGLQLSDAANGGGVGIHAGHANALAALSSLQLKKGATLYTDGHASMTVQNLSAQEGSAITNNGDQASTLELRVTDGQTTSIASGVLSDSAQGLSLLKTGEGTLSLSGSSAWSGGITIREGKVVTHTGNGGIGAATNTIHIEENGILRVEANQVSCGSLASTMLNQTFTGTGTVELANGKDMLLTKQGSGFAGTIHVTGNTRLYIGKTLSLNSTNSTYYDTVQAYDKATIKVDDGSQVRITANLVHVYPSDVVSAADYIISGAGKAGTVGNELVHEAFTAGALSIDCAATITGNVTLADDATIASWSNNPASTLYHPDGMQNFYGLYRCNNEYTATGITQRYGMKEHLGGTIRGLILGEGKTLSLAGTEGITITADSANTFGDLVIASANGNNNDKFALRLDGGKAKSQTSTALGKGKVTLGSGLILRLAGTGTGDQTDVAYTYANNITAGDGATLQSYNITNKLTGTVTMGGSSLNLATANGGVLDLAGGISGSGSLNVAAGSKVLLGAITSSAETPSFTISAGAGADITLNSATLISGTTISGTDSLTLGLGGAGNYNLGGITLGSSTEGGSTALTLHFNFADTGISAAVADSYASLTSGITAGNTSIMVDMNMFEVLAAGDYTLISNFEGDAFTLGNNTSDGRLHLSKKDGALVLTVDADTTRLFWSANSDSQDWNTTDSNWSKAGAAVAFTAGSSVVLDGSGALGNAEGTRETISLNEADLSVGSVSVMDADYEIAGSKKLTGTMLNVGTAGDLKLSTDAQFTEVKVQDGSLSVNGSTLTGAVAAAAGATVRVENDATLAGNITMADNAAVAVDNSAVQGNIVLNGSGSLSLNQASLTGEIALGSDSRIIAGTFDGTNASYSKATLTGSLASGADNNELSLSAGTITMDKSISLSKLTLGAGTTATLWNATETAGQKKQFGTLAMGNGATLEINNRVAKTSDSAVVQSLVISGTANINEVYDAGYLKVASLNLADGTTAGELVITKNSKNTSSAYTSVFDFGSATTDAGNFAGKVVLNNTSTSKNNHSAFINIYNSRIFAETVVSMQTHACANGYLGLGISTDGVQIAGLESLASYGNAALLFSGYAPTDQGWNSGDGPNANKDEVARTLTINTAANTSYEYHGQVREQLGLVKQGEGSQAFLGNADAFNGSIDVQGGTFTIGTAATGLLTNATGLTVDNGTLDLSKLSFSTSGGILISSGTTFSFGENAVLDLGSLATDTTYSIFDLSAGGQLLGWETMSTGNFRIDGSNLASTGRAEIQIGPDGTFLYTINSIDRVWNGGASGTWNQNADNMVWQVTDSSTGEITSSSFLDRDNAIFTGDATATLGADIRVNKLEVQSGTVVINDASDYTFRVNTAAVADGAHLQIKNGDGDAGADNVLTKVVLGKDATLSVYSGDETTAATPINTLQIDDTSAIVKDVNHSGYITIGTLNMGEGQSSATLNLQKGSASRNIALFEFGSDSAAAGNFVGEINLNNADSSNQRTAAIIISGQNALAGAHINLASNASTTSYLGLGINTANATIAGLKSSLELANRAKLFSGTIGTQTSWDGNTATSTPSTVSDAVRTLTINTAKDTGYEFYGEVVGSGKINLVKEGEGTQKFLGSGTFGSLTVNKGTLTLGGTTTTSGAMTINAGKVVLNQASGTTYTLAGNVTGAGTLEVAAGTTLDNNDKEISSNLALQANAQAELNGAKKLLGNISVGTDATLKFTGSGSDTLYWGADQNSPAYGKSISVDGGTIDFGSTRQTLALWDINLSNGAKLIANDNGGGSYNVNGQQYAALDINKSGENTISATSGDNTISAKTRLRDGSTINYSVAENASLNVSGLVHADGRKKLETPQSGGGIVKQGAGVLYLNNTGDELDRISVTGGTANIHGAAEYTLTQLQAATKVEVGFFAGTTKDTATQSAVTVSSSALLGGGALLNTSLTLAEGATLDMTGLDARSVTLSGALTFGGKVTMGDNLLAIVNEMSGWQVLELFTGLSGGVVLPSVAEATDDGKVLASEVFTNVTNSELYVSYQVIGNVGSLMVVHVPEPTTTTLGLLALTALAARRRRK